MEPRPNMKPVDAVEPTPGAPSGPPDLAVEVQGVDFFYGKSQALFGVDLAVERNKITALIGPSGCGKSTLLRTLNRIYASMATSAPPARC